VTRALLVPFALFVVSAQAQELVPNGDLEQYTACPDYVSQIERAVGWSRPTEGTSDYFNGCAGIDFSMGVPDNQFGHEPAHSGDGYAGFYGFYGTDLLTPINDYREYVTHGLSGPLVPGNTYGVSFHVSLSDMSRFALEELGVLFSTAPPTRPDDLPITRTPQVVHTGNWLSEKNGWTRVSGCFTADSAYTYLTIGNFRDAVTTAFIDVGTPFEQTFVCYYFIDDVGVRLEETPALGPDVTACGPVELAVLDPIPEVVYTWSTDEEGPSITVDTSGTYSVQHITNGCVLTDTVLVTIEAPVALLLAPDTVVDLCTTPVIGLDAGPLPSLADVLWSTGATTHTLTVSSAGAYTVYVEAPGHCPATASITVTDTCNGPLYAPNAFTPDGDGRNDRWLPLWRGAAAVEVSVYDRWGERLATLDERSAGWDGTREGTPLPAGVYAWKGRTHDPRSGTTRDVSGHIVLIR
jgi:gliding motility-associated-like protein